MANAILIPGKEKRVYSGHPWVFRSDIARVEGDFTPGDIVSVYSSKGKFLAKAFYNPQSQISLRIMSLHDEPIDRAFIFRRVKEAVDYRRTEGLEQLTGVMYGTVPDRVEMVENGVHFWVDVKEGQKTGFFLDQKENRAAIAPFVKGKTVLDCFTHTGSFALHAGHYGAKEVTGVDISAFACEFATENARLNGLENVVHFVEANAFDLLAEQSRAGVKYDVVILDPPAFTKTRSAIEAATRGYKEINLRAMKMVKPGGYLITCSCSQHILPDAFMQIVRDAAHDAHVQLRQVEYRTQGRDHPILPAAPETQYLKCGIFQIFD